MVGSTIGDPRLIRVWQYDIFHVHVAICLPMQYLAGACYRLADQKGFSFR